MPFMSTVLVVETWLLIGSPPGELTVEKSAAGCIFRRTAAIPAGIASSRCGPRQAFVRERRPMPARRRDQMKAERAGADASFVREAFPPGAHLV
jgi:hypothetical protein